MSSVAKLNIDGEIHNIQIGDIVLVFDPILYHKVGRDHFNNEWAFQPAEVVAIEWRYTHSRYTLDVRFLYDDRTSHGHFADMVKIADPLNRS